MLFLTGYTFLKRKKIPGCRRLWKHFRKHLLLLLLPVPMLFLLTSRSIGDLSTVLLPVLSTLLSLVLNLLAIPLLFLFIYFLYTASMHRTRPLRSAFTLLIGRFESIYKPALRIFLPLLITELLLTLSINLKFFMTSASPFFNTLTTGLTVLRYLIMLPGLLLLGTGLLFPEPTRQTLRRCRTVLTKYWHEAVLLFGAIVLINFLIKFTLRYLSELFFYGTVEVLIQWPFASILHSLLALLNALTIIHFLAIRLNRTKPDPD